MATSSAGKSGRNGGGGNDGGGDPIPAPEQPDSDTNTVAWKLATIDAEAPVSKTDPRVFDYA